MSATLYFSDSETAAERLNDAVSTLGATSRAQLRLRDAEAALKRAQDAHYCCTHSRNQAVGAARKQVKRWEGWLADAEVLREDAPEQRSFENEWEWDDEDDEEGDQ